MTETIKSTYSVLDMRLQLLSNGYSPLPNIAKACMVKGWPGLPMNEETIRSWSDRKNGAKRFEDTGLRVENGLAVVDLDINHEVIDVVAKALEQEEPDLARALIRYGKGFKEAWFIRTDEPFTRLHTRRWLAPDADLERDGAQVVEVFGGASPRQFGAFGAHTRSPSGDIEVAYEWAEASPLNTPIADLPEIPKARLIELVDMIEQILEREGFTPVLRSVKGESEATRVHDLLPEHTFECNDGVVRTLGELEQAAGEEGLRCSAAWLEPGANHSLTRCIIGLTHGGALTIWDAATGVSHMSAALAPADAEKRQLDTAAVAARLRRLAEVEEERKTKRRAKLSAEDEYTMVAAKLTQTYAYCKGRQLPVVPIWASDTGEGYSMTNFRTEMLPYCGTEIGPRGGEKKINPVDIWAASHARISVEGMQLRPDAARPLFVDEHGKQWVNTYTPPIHADAGGEMATGHRLLAQLLPDLEERRWFTQWLAHKYRNPHIPGPAVVMVAREMGTGRGTLGELLRQLFGGAYVRTLSFDTFAGRTYQSQYNDWGANSLMVLVNESSTSDGGSAYKAKHDTYERLKETIDPRPIVRHFVVKGEKAFYAPGFTSFLIATNNPDALPLPAGDRRFWVGTNGEPRDVEFWDEINAWIENPANIAAFADFLDAVDLSDYSPFAMPPMTDAKRAMTEMASSDLDRGFDAVLANMVADLITPEQIIAGMIQARDLYNYDYPDKWQAIAKRMVQTKLIRVGVPRGQNWLPMIDNKRYSVYALDARKAKQWTTADAHALRAEVLRNGSPAATGLPGNVLTGMFRQTKQGDE